MPHLPGGLYTIVTVCSVALILVAFFALRELMFSNYSHRGERLFNQQDYRRAIDNLLRAERFWMLNTSKQTPVSRANDCRRLAQVIEMIGEASKKRSISIDISAYRNVLTDMEEFFLNQSPGSAVQWPHLYSKFRDVRKRFHANTRSLKVTLATNNLT